MFMWLVLLVRLLGSFSSLVRMVSVIVELLFVSVLMLLVRVLLKKMIRRCCYEIFIVVKGSGFWFRVF